MAHIEISPASGRVVVRWRGHVVVDTTQALELREGSYPPVLYLPRADADMKLLPPSPRHTTCPLQGRGELFHACGERRQRGVELRDAEGRASPPSPAISPSIPTRSRSSAPDMPTATFKSARDLLLALRDNYEFARSGFQWPKLKRFNWALDWFDAELARDGHGKKPALKVLGAEVETMTFAELSEASNRAANAPARARRQARRPAAADARQHAAAVDRDAGGDEARRRRHPRDDAADRRRHRRPHRARPRPLRHRRSLRRRPLRRLPTEVVRIAVRGSAPGWRDFAELLKALGQCSRPTGRPGADDPLLLYFTSGTTARPKLVMHTHTSYPVGHLSTMFGLGLKPGDVHLNISSPGWAKHAWSNVFAPWNAGACILAMDKRFDARGTLDDLVAHRGDLVLRAADRLAPARSTAAGGLDGVAARVELRRRAAQPGGDRRACAAPGACSLRDSYGQTETTMMVGNRRRPARRAGLDGPAAAGLSRRAARRRRAGGRRGRDRDAAATRARWG